MSAFRRVWFFLTRWRRIRDLDEEMRFHVEMRAAANRERGVAADRAAQDASRRFGNLLKLREESRDTWGFGALERLEKDARYAAGNVFRRPVWTLLVVSTLAIGVGATTSIFTLVDTMLFKPAPWNTHGQLVWITPFDHRDGVSNTMSYPDYLVYRTHATTMSGMLAFSGNSAALGGKPAELVNCGMVSGNYFDVLGIRAQIGRLLQPGDDGVPGADPVVVLSAAVWRAHFGGDPAIVNTPIVINGVSFTVVGVAARGFTGVDYADNAVDLWVPFAMEAAVMPRNPQLLTTNVRWVEVLGRLREDRSVAVADAEVQVIARQLNPPTTPRDRERSARALPLRGGITPQEQQTFAAMIELLAIAPAIVLLVACANVANALMARNTARRRELAIRRAVGASRGRLIRLLLLESLVLALLAAAAGFGFAFALTALILHVGQVPADFSALMRPDYRALIAAMVVATAATLLSGLWPALTATKFNVLPMLKEEGPTATDARGRTRVRRGFVVAQVALSLLLVIVAGLFVKSLGKRMSADPGFDTHHLVTVSFDTSMLRYDAVRRNAFMTAFAERATALPGVTSVALTDVVPLSGEMFEAPVVADGHHEDTHVLAVSASVSPHYFETMRLPIIHGREFNSTDVDSGTAVVIMNETLAQHLWPGADPLGKRIRIGDATHPWRVVVGVARDAKYLFVTDPARAAVYVPFRKGSASAASMLVRTSGDLRATLSLLIEIANVLDPNLPLFRSQTFDEQIRHQQVAASAITSLMTLLGALTLLLAAVGLYSVAAHSVSLRTREIGIRMSLGARRTDVFRMVLAEYVSLSLVGIVVGLGFGLVGSRVVTRLLFGLSGANLMTFTLGAATLCGVAVIASYLPARWAAHVDPFVALRHE